MSQNPYVKVLCILHQNFQSAPYKIKCLNYVFIQMHLPATDIVIKLTQIYLIMQVNSISHVAKYNLMPIAVT